MISEFTSHRMAERLFGIFFILTFLSYGIGSELVASVAENSQGLAGVFANKTKLMTGVILMAIVHTFFNVGLTVLMFPLLKPLNRFLAYGYFCAWIAATFSLIVGATFLALLVPLSEASLASGPDAHYFETLALLLKQGGFYGYQLGMTLWGIGGLLLCYVLFISRLVPRLLSVWGLLGYGIFITGTISELYGFEIGVMLSIPGGLFEISLSLWLIIRGFSMSALAAVRHQTLAGS